MDKRKKLLIDDLEVDTFATSGEDAARGTVQGNAYTDSAGPYCEPSCGSCYTGAPTCYAVNTCFQTEPCFPTCNGADACNTSTCNISHAYSCGATCACDCIT
jgi:hypothetical protein